MVPPVLGIVGPTASGKTDLALAIAERLPVEIVVADSRQVYRGMDIGTAKVSMSAQRRVPHHLIDVADPDEPFTVADWVDRARALIPAIAARGRLPLVVGGTGLYVSALVDGHDYAAQPWSPELRQRLADELETDGLEPLVARLEAADPASAAAIDLRNPRRVLRALERAEAGGGGAPRSSAYAGKVALVGLDRPRAVLYRRIDERARELFEARPSRGGAAAASRGIRSRAAADDRARLCRGRRLPGGGVEPGRGRGGHGTSHAAVREAPAHVVPSRPASHVDPAR